ncbi:MAG: acyl-CoA dehydrogenase, partial [Mycolicibacterium sp.]|nr:acyl-CoA dehydrogenase [Mycolicibacterium sp.]
MTVDSQPDSGTLKLLEDGLRKTMLTASGPELDAA